MEKLKECLFYEKKDHNAVRCVLCPQYCLIENGYTGFCNARHNKNGVLYSQNYGIVTAYGIDPIEKKPLSNFYPGSKILSIGSYGCNLKCPFCQNYSISQQKKEGVSTTPQNIVDIATHEKNNLGIAFTYNEPMIWYEFVLETAKLNKMKGKKNVLVTNGYINEEPLKELLPFVDAMNIDLKGMSDQYYKEICQGRLQPVLDTIKTSCKQVHVEITTLLVTDNIDDMDQVKAIAKWLSDIDSEIPLHLSRYFPRYHFDKPATEIDFMKKAKLEADKYLKNVYMGNI